jgi:cytochrome b561
MVGTNAILVITAWGLYYAGSDLLRTFAADVHIAVGIAWPVLVVAHVVLGRRTRKRAHPKQSRSIEIPAALQTVTFSEDRGSR